ncbi:Ribose 5-phosphate isomerase B [Devosia sp. LC5]|uniref:ribose 5-phosphate isomerase B n=1 Tax=Devosia sp. LC5 TaxID=1502724 RepID=UPI0004E44619|nr:ribose 5-phosphate isomerase B [Devosia sp. LC5]KFC70253.1 Ribose 5-phosphate isomerase B [Devosia sp. LC5]
MNIIIGSDHAGFDLKIKLMPLLIAAGHTLEDVGSYTNESCDFPDIAKLVCQGVQASTEKRGILVCGTGVGASIAANKFTGIRAAVGHDVHSAHQCVEHDDVNILCIGAKIVGEWLAIDLINAFLDAQYDDCEDHVRRLQKLSEFETH